MWLGVAGEGNEGPCGHSQGEEYLSGRLQPHLRAEQFSPLQRERECVCVLSKTNITLAFDNVYTSSYCRRMSHQRKLIG